MSTDAETTESASEPARRRRRARRVLVFLITAGAGFVLSLVVSTALARPAGAATLPLGAGPSSVNLAEPQLSAGQGLQAPGDQGGSVQTPSLASPPRPALPALTPPSGPDPAGIVSGAQRSAGLAPSQLLDGLAAVAPTLGPSVPTVAALGSVPGTPGSTGRPTNAGPAGPIQPVSPSALAAGGIRALGLMGPHGSTAQATKAHHSSPPVPDRVPATPFPPGVGPLTANESGSSLSSGSGAAPFGSLPPSGRLLPALVAGGAILAVMRARRLLLDLRYSPPG